MRQEGRQLRTLPKTNYALRQTELWEITTQGLSQKMRRIVNDKVLNHIKPNPRASETLHFDLEGLRSYNKLKSNNRIIFAICEECRKGGYNRVNNCQDCEEIMDNTIMLFAFGGHDIYEDLKRKRTKSMRKLRKKKKKLRTRGN